MQNSTSEDSPTLVAQKTPCCVSYLAFQRWFKSHDRISLGSYCRPRPVLVTRSGGRSARPYWLSPIPAPLFEPIQRHNSMGLDRKGRNGTFSLPNSFDRGPVVVASTKLTVEEDLRSNIISVSSAALAICSALKPSLF